MNKKNKSMQSSKNLNFTIRGNTREVTLKYLTIMLSQQSLTGKELDVATELVMRYTKLWEAGVPEPFASTVLFSTESRKEISKSLKITSSHLTNTFASLQKREAVVMRSDTGLVLNSNLMVPKSLSFEFHEEQG